MKFLARYPFTAFGVLSVVALALIGTSALPLAGTALSAVFIILAPAYLMTMIYTAVWVGIAGAVGNPPVWVLIASIPVKLLPYFLADLALRRRRSKKSGPQSGPKKGILYTDTEIEDFKRRGLM